jgi:hypothetical protein
VDTEASMYASYDAATEQVAPHRHPADVCGRMLTYADVCGRMLTYSDVC